MNKKILIFLILVFVLVSISTVSATDLNESGQVLTDDGSDVGTFTELNQVLNDSEVVLDKDYQYSTEDSVNSIGVSHSIVLDGAGHTINATNREDGSRIEVFRFIGPNVAISIELKNLIIAGSGRDGGEFSVITTTNCKNIKLTNVTFVDCMGSYLCSFSGDNNIFENCNFVNNNVSSYLIYNSGQPITLNKNLFISNINSMGIINCADIFLNNNVFVNNTNNEIKSYESESIMGNYWGTNDDNLINSYYASINSNWGPVSHAKLLYDAPSEELTASDNVSISLSNANLPEFNVPVYLPSTYFNLINQEITLGGGKTADVTVTPKDKGTSNLVVGNGFSTTMAEISLTSAVIDSRISTFIEPWPSAQFNYYGENFYVDAYLYDLYGNILINKTLNFFIGNLALNGTTNSEGYYKFNLVGLNAGSYSYYIEFEGDDNYKSSAYNSYSNLIVRPVQTAVTISVDENIETGKSFVITANVNAHEGIVTIKVGEDIEESFNINETNPLVSIDSLPVGEYLINVNYHDPNGNYESSESNKTITVSKASSNINVNAEDITYGSEAEITITSDDGVGGIVLIEIGNEGYFKILKNGGAVLKVPNLEVGNYIVNVTYLGDDKYANDSVSCKFSVLDKKYSPFMILGGDINVGGVLEITCQLDNNATGNVTVYVNGQEYFNEIKEGKVIFQISNLTAGKYFVNGIYDGDANFYPATYNDTFNVNKINPKMNVTSTDINVGDNTKIEVNLPNNAKGIILYEINGTTYAGKVSNGKANLSIDTLKAGDYEVNVSFVNDDMYLDDSAITSFKVNKINNYQLSASASDIVVGENAKINVKTVDDATGRVVATINGKNYAGVIDNGIATIDVGDLASGTYTATINYAGDDKYGAKSTNVKFNVSKVDSYTLNAIANNITEGNIETIIISLPNDANGDISIVVNSKTYTGVIDNGLAIIDIANLTEGKYNAVVSFAGDDKYDAISKSVSFAVDKDTTILLIAPNVVKYYSGPERFVVTVSDSKLNPLANQNVEIIINGNSYKRSTDANGQASIPLGLNSGTYAVKVVCGDISVDANVLIKSTVEGKDITKIYKNGTQYYATFFDENGKPLVDTMVSFNINGVYYNRTTDANGVARLNINLNPGTYIITGINPKTNEMGTNTITVLPPIIDNHDIVKKYRNGTQYTAKIIGDNGNPVGAGFSVTFNINGVFYTRTTDSSGIVQLNINLMPGEYIITAEYNGYKTSNKITVIEA